jgi:threonyl-tRNA synthetase
MYKTSGHLPYYAESMFPAMELSEESPLKQEGGEKIKAAMKEHLRSAFQDIDKSIPGL